MVEEKDFVLISIPFVAGTASIAASGFSGQAVYAAAAASQAASAILLLLVCLSHRKEAVLTAALFFALGVFSWCSSWLSFKVGSPVSRLAWISDSIGRLITECGFSRADTTSLLTALLTGDRVSLEERTIEEFRAAGASHILALSGLHLGIIYILLSRGFSIAGKSLVTRMIRSAAIICICGIYSLATGASASIVRAFIFICLNELSSFSPGRRKDGFALLGAALTLHLIFNPQAIGQVGFQLSYSAMLGIHLLYPRLKEWYQQPRWSLSGKIWNSAALALSCQIFTAPLVYFYFKSFPQNFLLTNIIVMPLAEAFIICGISYCTLSAAGAAILPIKNLTEWLGQAVLFCIKVISSIS